MSYCSFNSGEGSRHHGHNAVLGSVETKPCLANNRLQIGLVSLAALIHVHITSAAEKKKQQVCRSVRHCCCAAVPYLAVDG